VDGEKFYTVEEAAWILKPTAGRIRPMLRAGELEGHPSECLANFLENAVNAKCVELPFHALRYIGLLDDACA
jgi:hypothetical protein